MLKIKVSNLTNGTYDYMFEGQVSEIEIDEPYSGSFKTNVALSKFDHQIILDSVTDIPAILTCDRCNSEYQTEITSSYRMVYLFNQVSETNEIDGNELVFLHPDTDKIDLTKDVRDYAILAVPMKKLCREDCKGLCPRCGKNLNEGTCNCKDEVIDPRWETLQKLKLKNK
jgi:uncharacterized protein